MTYAELKEEIIDLGFEDAIVAEEYASIFRNSVNRAIDLINTEVFPIVRSVEIEESFDLATLPDFVEFDGNPFYTEGGERRVYSDFIIEGRTKIVYDGAFPLTVYYKALPTKITALTGDDFEIELPKIVQPLIAPLASYYVWLDDDPTKAAMYYNQFDQMRNGVLGSAGKPRKVTFTGGIAWHR